MELDEKLRTLNRFVIQDLALDGFIFTMAAARLDVSGWQLVYAAAGHAQALLISSSGQVRRLESLGIVLGRLAEAVPGKAVDEINHLLETD